MRRIQLKLKRAKEKNEQRAWQHVDEMIVGVSQGDGSKPTKYGLCASRE